MIYIELVVFLLCGVCKFIGELYWHNAQRWIMPAILGLGISLVTHLWWLGILVYPCCIPIDLGYSVYGKSDGFDRGCWLFTVCFTAGLACIIFKHLAWYFYVPYCLLGGVWGATTRNLNNKIISPITGLLIGSLVFLVR